MLNAIIAKARGFIVNPVETFRQSRADEARTVLAYLIPLLLFDAIMTAIVSLLESMVFPMVVPPIFGHLLPVVLFVGVLIGGLIILLLFTVWVHILICLAGGSKAISGTFKAITYGLTPSFLLHWIPLIGIIFDLWSIVLMILGIRELQDISSGRALVVMIIAVMVPLIILIIIAMYLFVAMSSQAVPVAPPAIF
ncbi:YIP1 family protein [Methanoregula sp.]|uniref:YIP1 family protein n=1 Tax=Methanoregula sp. TaxID=2052170 RepID=UPI003C70FA83